MAAAAHLSPPPARAAHAYGPKIPVRKRVRMLPVILRILPGMERKTKQGPLYYLSSRRTGPASRKLLNKQNETKTTTKENNSKTEIVKKQEQRLKKKKTQAASQLVE